MSTFLALVRPSGAPISDAERARYAPRDGNDLPRTFGCERADGFLAMVETGSSWNGGTTVARLGAMVAVGDVHLHDRTSLTRAVGRVGAHDASDLMLVLRLVKQRGVGAIAEILGDFAFVIWDAATRHAIAARDTFGARPLYYTIRPDLIVFSSRARALASSGAVDLDFIADYLTRGFPRSERTIFPHVTTVPASSAVVFRDGTCSVTRFWSPWEIEPERTMSDQEAYETFRGLLTQSVAARMGSPGATWSHLSGGLDSSSVACIAQALARSGRLPYGLAGTITIVDTLGAGDEREFASLVVQQCRVPNEVVRDYWLWQDDGHPPPQSDAPSTLYPFYARDRRLCNIVRRSGGRVLLTGVGSDQYLTGSPAFFADQIARGHVVAAIREMARWSIVGKTSFWKFALENAVIPLLPQRLARRAAPAAERIPAWVAPTFARQWDMAERLPISARFAAPAGRKYAGEIALELSSMMTAPEASIVNEHLDVRSPFLHRPLVELGLRLPPELRTRPLVRKWVLREAMRGLLPERVRMRSTKSAINARVIWSLIREREVVDTLLEDSLLAQLGCIDVDQLRAAVALARSGDVVASGTVMIPLSLETWLRVRTNQWVARERARAVPV
ncbi:MAG: hypothetical protein IRY91_05630 [Gemmatimonadaceae bacterium]|nr:hypothetical protein [Gemmatimonadaceae bacterium]